LNLLVKELILLGPLISKSPKDQKYMFLRLKTPYQTIFSINFAQIALAAFAIFAGLAASGSVFLNDLYFWVQSANYINPYLYLIAFLLAFCPGVWGLTAIIFLLPLSAGLGTQLNAYLGTQFLILPNAGLDLVAGFFLGSALREISKYSHFLGKNRRRDLKAAMKDLVPWPIALVIVMITISTAIAISRNVYQSAAATSFKGLLFNLVHFRPIGWHDDYMPISDWIAYALAVAMIILVIGQLKGREDKSQIIFRPVMAGLIIASLMGISQAITGLGLPENLLNFRKDHLGYAVIGFQPDLHAFAGHMLLGAVGLWGYFYSGISRLERKLVMLVVALSWAGIILSKSRALFLIAVAAMLIWLIWSLWQKKSRFFLTTVALLVGAISIFIVMIFNYSNHLSGIPVLSWLGELSNEFKSRDLTSWSLFSGIFGARFEIWEAAIRMWWEFPFMGIGQGNFYRLSEIASFSKSHFLILNHGENAHNYFLQTLTETGIVSVAAIAIALSFPLIVASNKRILWPVICAMGSLFLGNIFSHAFLVRENFLLASVLVGLAYGLSGPARALVESEHQYEVVGISGSMRNKVVVSICALIFISALEIFFSFGKMPFAYGFFCKQKAPMDADGWTRGAYILTMPINMTEVLLNVSGLPYIQHHQNVSLEVNTYWLRRYSSGYVEKLQLESMLYPITSSEDVGIMIPLSQNQSSGLADNFELEIHTSKCYSPRNMGDSVDSRLLGIKIQSLQVVK
jgi:O-antigen ligase